MRVDEFRSDLEGLDREEVPDRIRVYTYELNLLIRLARAHGIHVAVDTVDRADYTEIIVKTGESR